MNTLGSERSKTWPRSHSDRAGSQPAFFPPFLITFRPWQTPQPHGVPDPINRCRRALIEKLLEGLFPSSFFEVAAPQFSFTLEELFLLTLLGHLLFLSLLSAEWGRARVSRCAWGVGGTERCERPGRPLVHVYAILPCSCDSRCLSQWACVASWVTLCCWSLCISLCSQGLVAPPRASCCSQSWVLRGAGLGARARLGATVQKRLSTWSLALMVVSAPGPVATK